MYARMQKSYISQHATFGSYMKPIKHKVEQSLYYWWWHALTLNTCYTNLCAGLQADANANTGKGIYKIYNDFGDVRHHAVVFVLKITKSKGLVQFDYLIEIFFTTRFPFRYLNRGGL